MNWYKISQYDTEKQLHMLADSLIGWANTCKLISKNPKEKQRFIEEWGVDSDDGQSIDSNISTTIEQREQSIWAQGAQETGLSDKEIMDWLTEHYPPAAGEYIYPWQAIY